MSANKLQKHYGKLTNLERFRLTLAAFERDDEGELGALIRTAPMGHYEMIEPEYTRQFDRMERMGNAVVKSILLNTFLAALAWGLEQVDIERESDDVLDPDAPAFERHCVVMGKRVALAWDALGVFCEELGITRAQALNLQCEAGEQLEGAVEFAQHIVDGDERLMTLFTDVHCKETDQDADVINAERARRVAERHADAVASYVAWLWEVWRGED